MQYSARTRGKIFLSPCKNGVSTLKRTSNLVSSKHCTRMFQILSENNMIVYLHTVSVSEPRIIFDAQFCCKDMIHVQTQLSKILISIQIFSSLSTCDDFRKDHLLVPHCSKHLKLSYPERTY